MVSKTSLDWGKLDAAMVARPAVAVPCISLEDVITRLQEWRKELEQDGSLADVKLQADHVFWDICEALGLLPDEMIRVLGETTYKDLKAKIDG